MEQVANARIYEDGWWLRTGRLTIGKDDPAWHGWRSLSEREGWTRVWRWNGYSATWKAKR